MFYKTAHPSQKSEQKKVGNCLVKTKVKGHFTGIMFSWALTPLCRRRRQRRHPGIPNPICCLTLTQFVATNDDDIKADLLEGAFCCCVLS